MVLGNSLRDWLLAALAFLFMFLVLPLVRTFLRRAARRHAGPEQPIAIALFLHLLQHTSRLVLLIIALYVAGRILTLPRGLDRVFDVLIVLSSWLQMGIWAMATVRFGLERRTAEGHDPQLAGTLSIVAFVAQLVVWSVVVLLAFDNLGVNITALVAGLGVGGIAIALAVQTILGDLFASLSIALDKPFMVGDLLRIDDIEGTVEQIGIKSTRLRSVTGEQVILSNAELLKSRVRNLGRMNERRALFMVSVAYDTPHQQLDEVSAVVESAVAEVHGSRLVHCRLKNLGESALEFEVVFYVPHALGDELPKALDAVNRGIVKRFAASGIEFAYPTRTLHIRQEAFKSTQ